MVTLFSIGDKIDFTVTGKIVAYEANENGDCYTIEIPYRYPNSGRQEALRLYMTTEQFENIEWKWREKINVL